MFNLFHRNRRKLLDHIQTYKPIISSVSKVRVLLIGPVGAGKSSFFNSIKSIFRGHVTSQAMAGSSGTSLTTQVDHGWKLWHQPHHTGAPLLTATNSNLLVRLANRELSDRQVANTNFRGQS